METDRERREREIICNVTRQTIIARTPSAHFNIIGVERLLRDLQFKFPFVTRNRSRRQTLSAADVSLSAVPMPRTKKWNEPSARQRQRLASESKLTTRPGSI